MVLYVTQSDRLLFKLVQQPGKLVGKREVVCAFASGESLNPQTEETIFAAAGKAKDWESLIFKLRLEGFDVREGETLRLPFGKL